MSYKLSVDERNQIIKSANVSENLFYLNSQPNDFQQQPGRICTLVGDALTDGQILEFLLYRNFRSIVQNSFQPAPEKLDLLRKISESPVRFLELDFQLLEEGCAVRDFPFTSQTVRDDIIAEVCEFVALNPASARVTRLIQSLEELIMNAQVNAPALRPVNDSMLSYIKVEYTDNLIALSAFDYYGSLDCKKFLKKIESGLALGLSKAINFGKGGAGIGSSIIYHNCDSLFLAVTPNRRTRVSVIMPYNVPDRKFDGLQRSVSILELK